MKIIRTSTVPTSLNTFCKGLLSELKTEGYEIVAVSSPGHELDEVGRREGVKTYAVKMERSISPLKDLRSLWKLVKVFRREKPELVHSITPKAGLLSMIAARIAGVPVRLHTFTGLIFPTSSGLKRKILMLTDRITCACATHVSPEGEGVKDDLINFHITRKPLKVLGFGNIRGVDLKHYDPELPEVQAEAAKIRRDDIFTFIYVGRLGHTKGTNELVATFKKLNEQYPATRLVLVGATEQNHNRVTPETVAEIERNPAIEYVGRKQDVRPWFVAADALAFPTVLEGVPNVVIEASAMGLPSIVTDINGSREVIINDLNGIIIPPNDRQSLYQAMEKFVTDRGLVNRLASKAREAVASRYEQGFVRQCLKDYYKEILNETL